MERKIYTPPYQPQSNGRIEGFHNFLKSCLAKHISKIREWDDVAPLATTSYNWLPNQHSKESPFFVMFGRDALTNLKHLISPKLRYMGMEELILDLEIMSNIYQLQILNLKLARQHVIEDQRPVPNPNINTGDLVLVIGWLFTVPTCVVGELVIIYYRQVCLLIGIAWLCQRWYRILLIGCLHLSLGCNTWFTS